MFLFPNLSLGIRFSKVSFNSNFLEECRPFKPFWGVLILK